MAPAGLSSRRQPPATRNSPAMVLNGLIISFLRSGAPAEAFEQFAMDAVEPAVAENADDVTALRAARDVRDDGIHPRQVGGIFPGRLQVLHQFFGIQPFVGGQLIEAR